MWHKILKRKTLNAIRCSLYIHFCKSSFQKFLQNNVWNKAVMRSTSSPLQIVLGSCFKKTGFETSCTDFLQTTRLQPVG